MGLQSKLLFSHTIFCDDGQQKQIKISHGDIAEIDEQYDVLVCSAFKGKYSPYANTLIGSLSEKKGISVEQAAQNPELVMREEGCWVSKELPGNFKRIACVELLETVQIQQPDLVDSIVLKSTFAALYSLLERLEGQHCPITSVVLPVLGSGNQGIELCYIVPVLLSKCIEALKTISSLKTITFFEINLEKAKALEQMCRYALKADSEIPKVFISYCSKQQEMAYAIKGVLEQNGITCWMAPESIPAGSSYQKEIPKALSQIPTVLLLLSPEAEASKWVQKEIGCTIGAKHALIPYKFMPYEHSVQFNFLLDGEQIFEAYKYSEEEALRKLVLLLAPEMTYLSVNPMEAAKIRGNVSETEKKPISDDELLTLLMHYAYDPAYKDKKEVLEKIKQLFFT